jgi:hypothetical protein
VKQQSFVAHASRLQALVGVSCFLPIVAAAMMNLILIPGAPVPLRVVGGLLVLPFLIWFGVAARLIFMRKPVLEIDESGLLWRRWSETRIPWAAFDRWRVKTTLGIPFATLWLREPTAFPAASVQAVLRLANRWLGYGDITLNAAGTDRTFEELAEALRRHAPPAGTFNTTAKLPRP